jgi:hypothetical protein
MYGMQSVEIWSSLPLATNISRITGPCSSILTAITIISHSKLQGKGYRRLNKSNVFSFDGGHSAVLFNEVK